MSAPFVRSISAHSVHDDFLQAQCELEAIHGKDYVELHPELVSLGAIWRSIERQNKFVQASARVDDWQSSEAATVPKDRARGIEACPGESIADYRARIERGSGS